MRSTRPLLLLLTLHSSLYGHAQARKISEPPGNTLQKALKASTLGQPGAKPFHVHVEIGQTKGAQGDYAATVEETWVSPTQWVRTVTTPSLTQKTVVDTSGPHILTQGDYFPAWLRNFVTAVFTPVPEPPRWNLANAPVEHVEFPNGMRSSPCQHAEFRLGTASAEQINFANNCFRAADGLLELAQSPDYAMEFKDYAPFEKFKVARTLIEHPSSGIEVIGKVTVLEAVASPNQDLFVIPSGATTSDPLATITLPTATMLKVSNGLPALHWPNPMPGHGMFTAWVNLDRTGRVREAHSLNSDESGLAAEMTAQLVGMQWKPVAQKGSTMQAQGPLVFAYPPPSPEAADQK